MKPYLLFTVLYLFSLTLAVAAPFYPPDQDHIEDMTVLLLKSAPADFLRVVSSNRWTAPVIWSKWYVDRVQDKDALQVMVRNRAFGRALVARLDDWATDMRTATSLGQCTANGAALLDVADWLASAKGYGNLLLASRCRDIAAVGLGKVVADLGTPLEAASSLVSRLDAPWFSPFVRAAVLDAEAGTNLFNVSGLSPMEAEKRLEDTWRNGRLLRLKYSSPEAKAAFEGQTNAANAVLAEMVQRKGLQPDESAIFQQNLSFFADDPLPRPLTLPNMWGAKRHEKLVVGFDLQNVKKIKALLAFRSVAGVFPASQDEFKAAWVPHITGSDHRINKEQYHVFASAWQAYKEITSGEFVDEDTKAKRLDAQMTAMPDPNTR
jgi:hypothetical protein